MPDVVAINNVWSGPVDVMNIDSFVTLTRYTDPANNSDKFRRFIVLSTPGEPWLLLTQTGRWTAHTARGDWNGGVYSLKKVANGTATRRAINASRNSNLVAQAIYLETEEARSIGAYHREGNIRSMTLAELKTALDRAKGLTVAWNGSQAFTPPAPQSAPTQPSTLVEQPKPAPLDEKIQPASGALDDHVSALIINAGRNVDAFDLMADLAVIRSEFAQEKGRIDRLGAQIEAVQQQIFDKL